MDEVFKKLIEEFWTKAREARAASAKLGYKHQNVKGNYNTEASIYERCATRLEEEWKRYQEAMERADV